MFTSVVNTCVDNHFWLVYWSDIQSPWPFVSGTDLSVKRFCWYGISYSYVYNHLCTGRDSDGEKLLFCDFFSKLSIVFQSGTHLDTLPLGSVFLDLYPFSRSFVLSRRYKFSVFLLWLHIVCSLSSVNHYNLFTLLLTRHLRTSGVTPHTYKNNFIVLQKLSYYHTRLNKKFL